MLTPDANGNLGIDRAERIRSSYLVAAACPLCPRQRRVASTNTALQDATQVAKCA